MSKYIYFFLFCIFVLGFFLRFVALSSYPVGFHLDEASKGYTAYSLLKTGKDDNNNYFPLYIDIFSDNSPPGYHYITMLPVAVFGLTEFAVRFPGAFFGAFSVLALYFLAYSIFEDRRISLLSALLLAISPWHINLSRASSEALIALFFIILGFSLLIRSLKTQVIKHLIVGTILLSISFFFYQTPRVFVPLLFLVLGIFIFRIWKIKVSSQYKKAFIFSFLLLSLLDFVLVFAAPGGTGRFSQVNIFSYLETRLVMEEQIREDGVSGTSVFITRFFHNKVISYFLAYVSNYLEYFSWNFLFIKNLPSWYFVPNMGVMYLIELPFVLYGLFLLAFSNNKIYKILLLWLIIAPITAAVTVDMNNLQRAIVMYPILEIIAAYGLAYLFTNVIKQRRTILIVFTTLLFLFNFSYFLHQYFVHSKIHRPWYRNNGFAEMIKTIKESYDDYDKIVITKSIGGIYPLVQFYMQYDPKKYQQEGSPKDAANTGFGKFYFVLQGCPFTDKGSYFSKTERILYVENGECVKEKAGLAYEKKTILREDGTKAFRMIYSAKPGTVQNPVKQN